MVNVTPVNDPPVASDRNIQVGTTTTRTLSMSDFPFVDANDLSPLNPTGPQCSGERDHHRRQFGGRECLPLCCAVSASLPVVIAASDLTAGGQAAVQFRVGAGLSASFTFRIQDNGGTASGGIDIDPIIHTMTLPVGQGPNQVPSGSDHVIATAWEDVRYVFQASDFGFADPDGNNFRAVKITTTPASGLLTLNGALLAAGQAVFVNDINNGLFRFVQSAANANGALASFKFQVQDDGGTLNGGVDLDPTPRRPSTLRRLTTPGIRTTSSTRAERGVVEDSRYMFAAADFGFNDVLDSPADSFLSVKITTLPASGTLLLKGGAGGSRPGGPGERHRAGRPCVSAAGQRQRRGAACFRFRWRDSGGTANGGIDLDRRPTR